MTKKELDFLIQEGEGFNLEFKESYNSSIAKEICAMANASGGKVLIGVTDTGKIKPVNITNKLRSEIMDLVRNFDPSLKVAIEEIETDENWFTITFMRPDLQKITMRERLESPEGLVKTTQKTIQKTTQKIIELIRKNPNISREELSKILEDITESGVKYNLNKLKNEGLIKRVGPDKGGHWEIVEK